MCSGAVATVWYSGAAMTALSDVAGKAVDARSLLSLSYRDIQTGMEKQVRRAEGRGDERGVSVSAVSEVRRR